MLMRIFVDEAGNTGGALLDVDQPVFVHASNNLSESEAAAMLDLVRSPQTQEVKFSRLRRIPAGQRKILDFLRAFSAMAGRSKTTVFHKRYMVVTKIVDVLIETIAHQFGQDLYRQGRNIAMSNLIITCFPVFLGRAVFDEFLSAFVRMLKEQTDSAIQDFYLVTERISKNEHLRDLSDIFVPLRLSRGQISSILALNDASSLDPAIPSFFNHCVEWGKGDAEFEVVHDSSKPIKLYIDVFNAFMSKDVGSITAGYDRRKFSLPLRSTGIQFADSKNYPQIQVADLVAGATAGFFNARARQESDEFIEALGTSGLVDMVKNIVWPDSDVSPETLGTNEPDGTNPANEASKFLSRRNG